MAMTAGPLVLKGSRRHRQVHHHHFGQYDPALQRYNKSMKINEKRRDGKGEFAEALKLYFQSFLTLTKPESPEARLLTSGVVYGFKYCRLRRLQLMLFYVGRGDVGAGFAVAVVGTDFVVVGVAGLASEVVVGGDVGADCIEEVEIDAVGAVVVHQVFG